MSEEPIISRLLVDETGAPCPRSFARIHTNCSKCGIVVERAIIMSKRPIICFNCNKARRKVYNKGRYYGHKVEPRCAELNCESHKRGKWSPDYQKAIKDTP